MQNKIDIDAFVKQKLESKQEQLNLGAWSNMERMLNGQNPYAKEEGDEKKKPLYLRYLLGLLALIFTIGGAAVFTNTHKTKNQNVSQQQSNAKAYEIASAIIAQNQPIGNEIAENQAIDKNTEPIVDNNGLNTCTTTNNKDAQATSVVITENNNPSNKSHETPNTEITAEQIKEKPKYLNANNKFAKRIKRKRETVQNNSKFGATQQNNDNQDAALTSNVLTNGQFTKEVKASKTNKVKTSPKKIAKQEIIDNTEEAKAPQSGKVLADKSAKADSITKMYVSKKRVKIGRNKSKIVLDTVYQEKLERILPIVESASSPKLAQNAELAPKEIELPIQKKKALDVTKTNPRYVDPSITKAKKMEKAAKVTVEPIIVKQTTSANNDAIGLVANKAKVNSYNKKLSPMENAMQQVFTNTVEQIRKVGYMKLFHAKIPVNPGVFAGINGSFLNNAGNNYGGYHLGANLLMRIRKNISILPNLVFFAKNNSGYSIKDYEVNITQKSAPLQIDSLRYAFSYTKDSTTYTRNFKQVYSLEAPIAVQYNRKNLGLYGGLNLSYQFKMRTTSTTRGYQQTIIDTVYSAAANPSYNFPANKSTFYKSPDFNGRFGLGYMAGVNYHFTPKFYIDFRVSQNVWDNSNTLSSKDLSKKMFKLPSYQLTFGYRLKNIYD